MATSLFVSFQIFSPSVYFSFPAFTNTLNTGLTKGGNELPQLVIASYYNSLRRLTTTRYCELP